MLTDRDLVTRCVRGDSLAWEEMAKRIHHVVLRQIPDPDSSLQEELVQATMVSLAANDCRALRQFRGSSSLDTFLSTVVKRRKADYFRAAYRQPPTVSLEESAEHNDVPDPRGETDVELSLAIEQTLSDMEIEIVRLAAIQHTSAEIATVLSHFFNKPFTDQDIRDALKRIRKKLKREIPF